MISRPTPDDFKPLQVVMSGRPYHFHPLLHSGDLIEDCLRERLEPLGIGPRQARILAALDRMETASQAELAREFRVTAASMSTMTVRLVRSGLIARTVDPDSARSNLLSLSPRGRDMLDEIFAAWRDIDAVIEDAVGKDRAAEQAILTRALRDGPGGHVPGSNRRKGSLPRRPR